MKKIVITLTALLILIAIIMVFYAGCGSEPGIEGKYVMIETSGSGAPMFKQEAGTVTLEIEKQAETEGGKEIRHGTLTMMGETSDVVINITEKKISFDGGETFVSYTYREKKITIEHDGYRMVFKKQ